MERTRLAESLAPDGADYYHDTYDIDARSGLALPRTYMDQEAVRYTLEWARLSEVDPEAAEAVRQQMQVGLAATTYEVAGRVDMALRPLGNTPYMSFRPKSPESVAAKIWRRGTDRRPLSDLSGGMLVVRQEQEMTEEQAVQSARNTLLYLQGYFGMPPSHVDGSPTIEEGIAPWSRTGFERRVAKLWTEVNGRVELFEVQAYTAREYKEYLKTRKRYEKDRPKVPVCELGNLALLGA